MTHTYFVDLSSWFVLSFILAVTVNSLVGNVLDWMNSNKGNISERLKKLHGIHPLMKKCFSRARVNKALRYNEENEKFSDLTNAIHGSVSSIIVVFGLIPMITKTLLLDFGFNTYSTYISLAVLGTILSLVVDTPFSYHQTFSIEGRNGFNRTTKRTFFLDILKSVMLNLTITSAMISVFNFTFMHFRFTNGNVLWLVLGFSVLGLASELLGFPLMRLFNRFKPLEDKDLLRGMNALFGRADYRNPKVYVMDASSRSTHGNAFVTGLGSSNKRIVLFDTLLRKHTKDEILSILAHEIGHAKKGHLLLNRILGILEISLVTFLAVNLMYDTDMLRAFGFGFVTPENVQTYSFIGFSLAMVFLRPFQEFLEPLKAKISRTMEYQADSYAVTLTKKKTPLISSLVKLTSDNLSDPFPNEVYEAFRYDHPSLGNRIANIRGVKNGRTKTGKGKNASGNPQTVRDEQPV